MKIGKLILALLVLAVAFGGGLWYGKQQSTTIIAANDAGGRYSSECTLIIMIIVRMPVARPKASRMLIKKRGALSVSR